MESDFVVQSNAPSSEAAANGKLRINSGFYRIVRDVTSMLFLSLSLSNRAAALHIDCCSHRHSTQAQHTVSTQSLSQSQHTYSTHTQHT